MKRFLVIVALCLVSLTGFAQQFAVDWGSWSIPGQKTDTYNNFPRAFCNVVGPRGNFSPFATNAPVLIVDVNPARNEVQTPATVVSNSGKCGVTFTSTTYSHASFSLTSGTGGLQEALNGIGNSSATTVTLVLDGNWYAAVSPTGSSGATIIAAAKGNTSIQLLDTTTSPYTTYVWNGSAYAKTGLSGSGSTQSFQGLGTSNLTAIAAPTATTATAAGPTGIAAGTYRYGQTCVSAQGGETLLSNDSAKTVTTTSPHGTITVPFPTCATGSVGWRLYVSADAGISGSEILYAPTAAGCTQATRSPIPACAPTSNAVFSALVTSKSKPPSQATAFQTTGVSSSTITQAFPTQLGPFADTGTQTFGGTIFTLGEVPIPASFLNSINKTIRVCGTIEETTVATAIPTYAITAANERGQSANTLVTWTTTAPGAQDNVVRFCATIKTAVTGASGTAEVHGILSTAKADGSAAAEVWNDANASATVAVGDLTKPVYLDVVVSAATASPTKGVLRDLQVEVLN